MLTVSTMEIVMNKEELTEIVRKSGEELYPLLLDIVYERAAENRLDLENIITFHTNLLKDLILSSVLHYVENCKFTSVDALDNLHNHVKHLIEHISFSSAQIFEVKKKQMGS